MGPARELPGEWATVAQISAQLGLSRQRIDQLRREHRLPAVRTPHGWLYNRAEVSQWGKQHYRDRRKVSDVTQTPKSSYSAQEAPPPPAKWEPNLNENQLAVADELEVALPPDAPEGLIAQALVVSAAWQDRAREEGYAGKLAVPDEYKETFSELLKAPKKDTPPAKK